ncbi:MAG: DUF805 domain-containing protein, partial [Actinobacteria bacterium]|nr:DUF805 domain-containing protein [Actinomycetota bacterium]
MSTQDFPPPPSGFGQGVPAQEPLPKLRSPSATGNDASAQVSPEHGFYSPVAAVKTCLQNYARFRGRAPRSQFWWFLAVWYLVYAVGSRIDTAAGFGPIATATQNSGSTSGPVTTVLGLLILVPLCAVFTRRMHDVGRTGAYILWMLTGIGIVWVLVRLCQSGGANVDNGYGVR